ncbi:MAG: dihydrodiol dehydrogenase [Actinomycetota bacterium]
MENDYIEISNEFATALVRKVQTKNGARLEIFAPKMGHRVYLDSILLESLSWQTPETLSRLLESPFGPSGREEIQGEARKEAE